MKNDFDQAGLYSKTNRPQIDFGAKLLKLLQHTQNETVLDIGCGSGELTYKIAEEAVKFNGRIIAIDPDIDRINLAVRNLPTQINNIEFLVDKAENLESVARNSIDVIFSSSVFNWIKYKKKMFAEFSRCLRNYSTCYFQCLQSISEIMKRIILMDSKTGQSILDKSYYFLSKNEWYALFNLSRFKVIKFEIYPDTVRFESLNTLLEWYRGTTHGAFDPKNISDHDLEELKSEYPGKIDIDFTYALGIIQINK